MRRTPARWIRLSLAPVLFAATALGQAPVQPKSEFLNRTKQLNAVAAQKAEADLRLVLRDATRLQQSAPAEAVQKLKAALTALDAEQSLTPERKETLRRVIRDQLRVVEFGPESAEAIAERQKVEEARLAKIKADAEKLAADNAKVRTGLEAISKLRKDGKTPEAEKQAAELAKNYPQNLSVKLLTGQETYDKAAVEGEKVKKEMEKAVVSTMRDVDSTGIPANGVIEFPKDWNERTKNRRDLSGPTPDERQLLQVLERPIEVRYKASRFQDAMDHLSELLGRTIMVDTNAMTEAGVTYDTPVNFSVRQPVATRTALRSILSSLNMTYVVRDNIIHVTTPARAKDLMVTKVYYLGDLITGLGPMGGAPTLGFNLDQIQMVQNITGIVEMIRGAVDPLSWENKGGQGSIGVSLQTMTIIVRQSQEVHALLRGQLYGGPKAVNPPGPK